MAGIAPVVLVLVMVRAVLMVNLTVAMANVSMDHGHVTAGVTVPMVQMKPTVVVVAALIASGHVTMDLAYLQVTTVTVPLNLVMLDGVLIVPMAQTKPLMVAVKPKLVRM